MKITPATTTSNRPKLTPGTYRTEARPDGTVALIEDDRADRLEAENARLKRYTTRTAAERVVARHEATQTGDDAAHVELTGPTTEEVKSANMARAAQRRFEREPAELDPPMMMTARHRRTWIFGCLVCGSDDVRRKVHNFHGHRGRTCGECAPAADEMNATAAARQILNQATDVVGAEHPLIADLKRVLDGADYRGEATVTIEGDHVVTVDVPNLIRSRLTWANQPRHVDTDGAPMIPTAPFAFIAPTLTFDPPAPRTPRPDPKRLDACPWCGDEPDADGANITVAGMHGRLCASCADADADHGPVEGIVHRVLATQPDTAAGQFAADLKGEANRGLRAGQPIFDLFERADIRDRVERLTYAAEVRRRRRRREPEPSGSAFVWLRPAELPPPSGEPVDSSLPK